MPRQPSIYEHVDTGALDEICRQKYQKTRKRVMRYLLERYPMGPRPEVPAEDAILPAQTRFKHSPDGEEVNAIVNAILPGSCDKDVWRGLKCDVEDNIEEAINSAISDALSETCRYRFSETQEALLNVTERSVTLVRLRPTSFSEQ